MTQCAFSPTRPNVFFTSTLRSVSVWDLSTFEANPDVSPAPLFTVSPARGDHQIVTSQWSPDGSKIMTVYPDGILIWDGEKGTRQRELTGLDGVIQCAAWSPSNGGDRVLAGSTTGALAVFELETDDPNDIGARVIRLAGHEAGIRCVSWSPDGSRAASGAFDSTFSMWNAAQGDYSLLQKMHCPGARLECFFSSSKAPGKERLLSYGNEPYIIVHDPSATSDYAESVVVRTGILAAHVLPGFSGMLDPTFMSESSVFGVVSFNLGKQGGVHAVTRLRFLTV